MSTAEPEVPVGPSGPPSGRRFGCGEGETEGKLGPRPCTCLPLSLNHVALQSLLAATSLSPPKLCTTLANSPLEPYREGDSGNAGGSVAKAGATQGSRIEGVVETQAGTCSPEEPGSRGRKQLGKLLDGF